MTKKEQIKGCSMHLSLPMLKDICLKSRKERLIQLIWKAKGIKHNINPKCRLCRAEKETVQHIIAGCPKLNASMYLPVRHNKVTKIIYDGVIQRNEIDNRMIPLQQKYANEFVEIWWDTKIKTM